MNDTPNENIHNPVMLHEVIENLNIKKNGIYIDATFGGGGHSRAILQADKTVRLLSTDCDPQAQERAQKLKDDFADRFIFCRGTFSDLGHNFQQIFGDAKADGIIFDLGVSSFQLETAKRGFSFMRDGNIDMRMGDMDMGQSNVSAKDIINECSMQELADIFFIYAQERKSYKIAQAIVKQREKDPFETTSQLATLCEKILHNYKQKIHPATRVFQALRICVNNELGQIYHGMCEAEKLLISQGRLVALTFHSLEDRIVKRCFRYGQGIWPARLHGVPMQDDIEPSLKLLFKKPLYPTEDEVSYNTRSRSAKLRVAVRLDAPARLTQSQEEMFYKKVTLRR